MGRGASASPHSEFRRGGRIRSVHGRFVGLSRHPLTAPQCRGDEVSVMDTQLREPEAQTFVETALKLGGKSEEEAPDDRHARPGRRPGRSPVRRPLSDGQQPDPSGGLGPRCSRSTCSQPQPPQPSPDCERTMRRLAGGRRAAIATPARSSDANGKVTEAVLRRAGRRRLLGPAHRSAVRRPGAPVRRASPGS